MSDTGLWRVQVTASRAFPANGLVPWALGMARSEAVTAGAARMIVTHGAARGGDLQADAWARRQARSPIPVIPDPVPVTPAQWAAWCPRCTDGIAPAIELPAHDRRRRNGPQCCPEAGHRRNSAMVAKEPPPSRGLAFFSTGLPNGGTMNCAVTMVLANVPLWCICDACGQKILEDGPCRKHSIRQILGTWDDKTGGLWPPDTGKGNART